MVLGAISCDKSQVRNVSESLRGLKIKHKLTASYELKWTKVSAGMNEYYTDLIDYFFDNPYLNFRAIVADKNGLSHEKFHQTHDEWYYKMYYLLLRQMLNPPTQYKIYLDIKDTRGGDKIIKLKDILNSTLYMFYDETVLGIQQINSKESEIIQLADLLIGALAYVNRELTASDAKINIVKHIINKSGISLTSTTSKNDEKLNIFVWKPRID